MRFSDLTSRVRRLWLALVTPQVRDDQPAWWDLVSDLSNEVQRLRHDLPGRERHGQVSEAEHAWRFDGRFRRTLKLTAAQTVGFDLDVVCHGDERVAEFLRDLVQDPRNGLPGGQVLGSGGVLLRFIRWYQATLRSGNLYPVLYPAGDTILLRSRPARVIAYVATEQEDWETEVWYAERQTSIPALDRQGDRSQWDKTWTAAPQDLRGEEMLHFALDPLEGSTQGESLGAVILPHCRNYQKLLDSRIAWSVASALVRVIVDMPGVGFQDRMARAKQLNQAQIDAGSFWVQDSKRERWEPMEARVGGGDAAPDLEATRNEVSHSAGLVAALTGDGDLPARASSRTVAPIAAAVQATDQVLYFGFLSGLLSRCVEKWSAQKGFRLRPWSVSVVSADTTDYERLEAARAFATGAQGLAIARQTNLLTEEEARSLARLFAGFPEDPGEVSGVVHLSLSREARAALARRRSRDPVMDLPMTAPPPREGERVFAWVLNVRGDGESGENCPDCAALAARGPWPESALPAYPRDGTTVCKQNCLCELVEAGS